MFMRIARIYPMYFITAIIAGIITKPIQFSYWTNIIWIFTRITFISCFVDQTLFDINIINYPSWSVALEFIMYLIFPFMIYALYQHKKIFKAFCYISIILIYTFLMCFQCNIKLLRNQNLNKMEQLLNLMYLVYKYRITLN